MRFDENIVLITGGASGIGFALVERFLQAGSTTLICGRRAEALQAAQAKYPQLHTRVCNVADPAERRALFAWASATFPRLNMLVNNAGIQQRCQLQGQPEWNSLSEEIAINLEAPIHLATLFIPHLLEQERAAILNVSSGLAFAPLAAAPVYCATKAGIHSFTLSLRQQLAGTSIEVIEIIPPAVNTDLGGQGLHRFAVPLQEFTDGIVAQLESGSTEVAYGFAAESSRASRQQLDAIFQRMNPPRSAG